jgi:FkbM family methyltransferase
MHAELGSTHRPLLERANDLGSRDLGSRLSRFLRSRARRLCLAGMLFADDPRVLRAWRRGWDSDHFIQLRRWKDEGFRPAVIYDIGANEGLWSEMCQAIFAPKHCLLFEPQPDVCQRARARAARVGPAWQILSVALGDRRETQVLHVTSNQAASSLLPPARHQSAVIGEIRPVGEAKVEVLPLDDLVAAQGLPQPDLVKIDVQGFEGRVLAGGAATLRRAQRIVVEVSLHPLYDGQSLLPEVLEIISSWGFVLQDINETFRQWPGRLWQVDLWLSRPVRDGQP